MSKSKDPMIKMDYLPVPSPRIVKMNNPLSPVTSDDEDESGLGYHHTLVSFQYLFLLAKNSIQSELFSH